DYWPYCAFAGEPTLARGPPGGLCSDEAIPADLADSSRNTGFAAGDTYAGIETLIGSYVDDELAGNDQDNELRGGYGNDVIWGRGGNDLLEGDVGDDRLIGGAGADVLFGNIDFLGYMEFIGRII